MKKRTISTIIISAAMLISAAFPGVNAGAAYTDIPSPVSHIEEIPPSVPTAPTGIKVTTTSDSATISWNKVSGASKYNIYFYAPSVKKYKLYYTTSKTSYTVKKLQSNSTYTYKISAVDSSGYESNLSAEKKFTTKKAETADLSAPGGIKATTTDTTATIKWDKVSGAAKYNIYFYDGSKGKYVLYYTTADTSYKVSGLQSNSKYAYKVSAVNSSGNESSLSDEKSFKTKAASSSSSSFSSSLSAPTGIKSTVTDAMAILSWNKVSGASKYNIYFYDSVTSKYELYYTTSSTAYTVKGLKSNSNYTYKISAATDTSESSLSSENKFTTKKAATSTLSAPTGISVSTSGTIVKVKWNKVEGASSYKLYFPDYSTNGYKHYYTAQNAYYDISGLEMNGSYTLKLTAVDSSGRESALSRSFSFKVGENDKYELPSSESTWDYINPKEQGTATSLDGKTVVVTIFASCKNAVWNLSGSDKKTYSELYKYVGVATEWLTSEAAGYGKKAEFVYDWKEHPDLFYTFDFSKTMDTKDMSDAEKIYTALEPNIDNKIDTAALKTQYSADNVVFLTFFNFKPTNEQRSATYWYKSSYSFASGYKYPYETVFIYNKSFYPGVIAHEMLHAFGAPDLYCSSDIFGITDEYVKYAEKTELNDIMRITWDLKSGNYLLNNLNNKITDITAYYLGLTDSSATVNKWKMKKRENTY